MILRNTVKNEFPELLGIYDFSKEEMEKSESATHDFSHVERVFLNALKICREEMKGDLRVVLVSALLHDIKRHEEDIEKIPHAPSGAEFAKSYLLKLDFPKEEILKVENSILCHSYSEKKVPIFIEGKILQDADRLETIGAIAIARVFNHNNGLKRPFFDSEIKPKPEYDGISETFLNHFFEKILKISPKSFWTQSAQKIAIERYKYTKEYVNKFIREWNGLE